MDRLRRRAGKQPGGEVEGRLVAAATELPLRRFSCVEKLLEQSGQSRSGEAADAAKDLVADYRKLIKTLKGFVPTDKKFSSDVKTVGDKIKVLVGQGKTHDQLLPAVEKLHDKIMAADETTLKEVARGRVASGDIQAKRIKIRDSLKSKKDVYAEFEKIASEEWNFCMTVYREVSEQIAEAHRQVERVLRPDFWASHLLPVFRQQFALMLTRAVKF